MQTPPRARKRDALYGGGLSSRMFFLIQLLICAYALIGVYRFGKSKSGQRLWRRLTRSQEDIDARLERRAALAEMDAAYKDTAMITLATGDAAAKHAVVLLQALRDTETVIPRLIVLLSRGGMGSEDCHNETLRDRRSRHYHCSSRHAVADDIVSQIYLDAFSRLGAEVRIIDEIPNTKYTSMIPGGRATFWGMSFNKLRIFDMVEFKKVLFIDADVLILKNIDWVMLEPDFTAAFTTECCNGGARGKLGGGMWVFEPSHARWNYTQALINTPCPDAEFGVRLARRPTRAPPPSPSSLRQHARFSPPHTHLSRRRGCMRTWML